MKTHFGHDSVLYRPVEMSRGQKKRRERPSTHKHTKRDR